MKAKINPSALYWAGNNVQIRIPGAAVLDIARPGDDEPACREWLPEVQRITAELYPEGDANPWAPTAERIRNELREAGAWDEEEMQDDARNWIRFLWLCAGDVAESDAPDCTPPVSDPDRVPAAAAAPCLLTAAKLALEFLRGHFPLEHGNPALGAAWGALEDAIAKAERGEA